MVTTERDIGSRSMLQITRRGTFGRTQGGSVAVRLLLCYDRSGANGEENGPPAPEFRIFRRTKVEETPLLCRHLQKCVFVRNS